MKRHILVDSSTSAQSKTRLCRRGNCRRMMPGGRVVSRCHNLEASQCTGQRCRPTCLSARDAMAPLAAGAQHSRRPCATLRLRRPRHRTLFPMWNHIPPASGDGIPLPTSAHMAGNPVPLRSQHRTHRQPLGHHPQVACLKRIKGYASPCPHTHCRRRRILTRNLVQPRHRRHHTSQMAEATTEQIPSARGHGGRPSTETAKG